jgi:hypothetical protein
MESGVEDGIATEMDEPQSPQDQPDERGADAKAAAQSGLPHDDGPTTSPRSQPADVDHPVDLDEPTDGRDRGATASAPPSTGEQIAGALDPEPDDAGQDRQGHGRDSFG